MRLILILLGYQLLVVLGTADKNSMDPSIEPSMCILDQCEQANASAVGHDHSMFAKIGRGEILSYIGEGISTKAKGGHGSVGRGRGSHISPANCMAALNPLSLLHGQILLLTSVSTTARAHTPLAKSLVQSQDHGLVAKVKAQVDIPASDGGEKSEYKLPKTRRDGCDAILGFDCGTAAKVDTGLLGRLVRWMKAI